jgi:anti-sigma B factor antagonist
VTSDFISGADAAGYRAGEPSDPEADPRSRGSRLLDIHFDEGTDGQKILRPVGELDASTVSQFREVLAELASHQRVLIDLSDVVFVDSAGLGALIGGIRRIRELGGDVVLARPRPSLARLLRTTGLDHIVTIASSIPQAEEALAAGTAHPN